MINERYPIKSELKLIEANTGLAIIKRKWKKAFIEKNIDMGQFVMLPYTEYL